MDKNLKLKKIKRVIDTELSLFELKLEKIIKENSNFLTDDLLKFVFSNPKRLRPIFVFLFAKVLKINSPFILNIALANELIHTASLLHDDIIDSEEERRGNPTFYKKFGSKISTLEGDFLLSLALEVLSDTNIEIVKIFSQKIKETIQGELLQNEYINQVLDENLYLKKTIQKTGSLFFCALESLFVLGDFDESIKNDLKEYLTYFSFAFQIKNDIENYISSKTDFKNGNYTLPVIYCKLDNTNEVLQKHIEKSKEKVEEFKKKALISISNIEENKYKSSLIDCVKLI